MATYKLSENIDKNKVFIVKRSEIEGRFEPEYYRPSIAIIEDIIRKKSNKKLKDFIIKISSGATPSITEKEKYYSDEQNGIPFLRVQNLQTNGKLRLDDVKYISIDTHNNYLQRSQVEEGDLLIKITGVGRMAIASVAPKGFIGNTNQHMVVIKTGNPHISQYLSQYLNLDIIESLATRRSTGGTRPALDYNALKSIPIIENIDFSIIYEKELEKQQKEAEAKALLDSIDGYLLKELGITLPDENEPVTAVYKSASFSLDTENMLVKNGRLFVATTKDLSGGRFDPDYYSDFYNEIIQKIKLGNYNTSCLKNVCLDIFSGKTPSSSDYSDIETEYPVIKVSSYDNHQVDINKVAFTKNKQPYSIQKGDIFILSAAHQAEYVGKHIKILEKTPTIDISFVGELLCIRVNPKCLNPIFLFSLLNTNIYKTLINREKTGQTSHIYPKDIKNIEIPLPPIEKQQKIATHIQGIRDKVLALQKEAESILNQAKNEVEQMILGN